MVDWICTMALLGPRTPVRRIDEFVERWQHHEWWPAMYNPQPRRQVTPEATALVQAHLARKDHGTECIKYPFASEGQAYPLYKGQRVCWLIFAADNPDLIVDKKYRDAHRLVHSCGDSGCINRGHFKPVKKHVEQRPALRTDDRLSGWGYVAESKRSASQ